MTAIRLTFTRRAWFVPSEGRAFEGWVEGRPTESQRTDIVARARLKRMAWRPDVEAWHQLHQLQRLVDQRVRIQFWNPVMYLLNEDDWPHPVEGRCEGVVTLIDCGHLQAFLMLADPVEVETGGSSGLSYLVARGAINCKLAPVADLYEVETKAEAA